MIDTQLIVATIESLRDTIRFGFMGLTITLVGLTLLIMSRDR